MSKKAKNNYQKNEEEAPKPKPRKEYSYKLANDHKAWILRQQEHNDWHFSVYPDSADFSKETSEDAYGIWVTSYQRPLIFGHPEFELDFEQAIDEGIFKFRVGEWDVECSGPPKKRWTDGHGKAWEFLLKNKELKRSRTYGSSDILAEAKKMILGEI